MSFFGDELKQTLEVEQSTQAELAARSKVNQSTINRLIGGLRPEKNTLRKVVDAVTGDPQRRIALVWAHLMDEAKAAGVAPEQMLQYRKAQANASVVTVPADLMPIFSVLLAQAREIPELKKLLEDTAQLALGYAGAKKDLANVYHFPAGKSRAVAEDKPLPRGAAQQPTA